MLALDSLTAFFGWCSVINIGILVLSVIILMVFKNPISILHSSIFGINKADLPLIYFRYLGNYKIAIFILNIAPYIALKIMV